MAAGQLAAMEALAKISARRAESCVRV